MKTTRCKNWMIGALLVGLSSLAGCASADKDTSCTQRLDEKSFVSVSEDTSCSDYQRASAYLGRAGFLFENFLKSDAADNYRSTLGVASSVTSWDTWEGKTYYQNAMQLSGDETGDQYEGVSRANDLIEIHLFSSLGAMLAELYIGIDTDADGTFAQTEINTLTNIRSSSDSAYGKNDISTTNWLQIVNSGTVYLVNTSTGACYTDSTYAGISGVNGASGSTTVGAGDCAALTGTVSGSCAIVATVTDVQNMFLTTVSASSNSVLTLTESIVAFNSRLNADMAALGLGSDSSLTSDSTGQIDSIDNGGTCSNSTTTEVNQLLTLVNSSSSTSKTSYSSYNKVKASSLSSSSDNSLTIPSSFSYGAVTFSCTNSSDMDARLVFQTSTSGTYAAYYGTASDSIKNTFTSLANYQLDASGTTKASVKGDGIISFSELLCATN